MFLIITLLCSVQSEFIIESLIQTDRLSPYNPQWQQRFMDRQIADNDLLAAAKQAQSFNDNLEHEVRVASNLEPIPHLGEYPTKLKMDSSRDATQINTSKLDQKIQQMKEQVAEESVFKIGWQDDDKLYNKVIEHLIELDPEEQADFLLQVLKNEMRSNRTRVVQRLHDIVQMIMDDILLVPLEKLYEITIRANMEMEIEEVFKEDLNLSLDPIRNGEIGEVEQLVEELQYDESNIIVEEEIIQHQLPIEYQIVLRKEPKLKDYNHLNSVQSIPINQVHVVNEQQIENQNIQKIKRIKLDDFFIVKNDDGGEEIVENGGEEVNNNNSEEQQQQQEGGGEEQQVIGGSEEQQQQEGGGEELQQQQEGSGEEQQQQQTEELQQQMEEQQQQYQELPEPGPGEFFRNPQIPYTQEYQEFIPHEYFNPIHRDDNYEQQYIPLTQQELNYQQRPIIPHEIFNPINEDDKYNVYGDKPKKVDPYFHYTHGNKTIVTERQEDVAQSINIVQGNAEMQSINIVMDPPEIQSINIQFDETQAEQYKQQQLYHKYRNQEHFINRGSFHYPNNPEYPNIHTINQPSPYYYDGYYTGEVPTHQYQEYEPKIEEPQIDEGAYVTEEIVQEFVNQEEIIIQGEEAAVEAIPEEGVIEGGGEGGEAGGGEGGEAGGGEGGEASGEEKGETGGEEKGEASGEEKGEAGGEEKGESTGSEEKGETTGSEEKGEATSEEKGETTGEANGEEKEQGAQPEENNEIPNQSEETVNPPPEESSNAALPEETLSPPPEETQNPTQDEASQIDEQFVPSNQINWENIPDEEIEYLLSRLIHPRFYDPYHPDYDPNDPRNIVFLEEHQKRSLIYLQVKHPLFYLPGEGPYSKLRTCSTPEDLLDQITQQDVQQLVAEWKRRTTKSNTNSNAKQSIYRPFSLDSAPIKQNTYEPRDPPKKKIQSTTEPVEIDDSEFVTPRDIGKFGKKRSNQQQQYDPHDPRSLPNFNPDSFQGNNEYRSDNPILKVVQGSKLKPEERGDYQQMNPDEFHKPPAFDDERSYRSDRNGRIKKDDYLDEYDEIYEYDDEYYDEVYDDYDDYGDYDREPHYRDREPRYRDKGRRYRDRDGDGIPDRYQYPPYYRRRPYDDDYDYDDYEGPPRESDERRFERELDRTKKGMRNRRYQSQDEMVSEYHVYHDIDQYNQDRDENDKRNRQEKAKQHPKYKPGNVNGSPRIRDTTQDVDDYPRREIGEDKDEMDTSGIAFAKSLEEQERQKQNKKKSKQKLKERGISEEDNHKSLSKNKNTQKQKNNQDKHDDDNKSDDDDNKNKSDDDNNQQQQNNNSNNNNNDNNKQQQQQQNNSNNETPKQQQNYQVKSLAANKSNNVNNSDSLIKPQNKETTKKEMSKANEIPEPDLKHQAKNNAEKNDENKSLGKNEEPLLNKKTKSLLQMSDESCQQMDSRSKTYTCVQCNANKSYHLNDDTWYLIGLAKGYKKEFHTIFKLIKELINPQQLYTSFGQENQICFSSQEKQKVNIQRIIQLFNGKEIKNTLIPIPNELMMSYFQLQYRNGTFNDFELDIDDNTIQIEKSGIKISKINIIWHNDQIQINKQGTLNIENLQRKFEHKQIIQNDCISENLRMYLHFPHDYQLSINMMKQLFNDVTYYTDYLLSQVNKDRWITIQYKQRICDDLHEYGITLT